MFLLALLRAKVKDPKWFYGILLLFSLPGMFFCKTTDYFTGIGLLIGYPLGIAFEERFVKFQCTKSVPRGIARVLGGGALYVGMNVLLKLPFSEAFLESATMPAFLVRVVRYAVILFVMVGVYPLCFERVGKKRG